MASNNDPILNILDGLPELMTCYEVAGVLRISRAAAYNLAARGELPSVRLGGSVRVLRADLEAFIMARRTGGDNGHNR